jgi:hypothetical protein
VGGERLSLKAAHTGVVPTGGPAILVKHIVLFEIPLIAQSTEVTLGPRRWFRLWLDLRAFIHVIMIDRHVALAEQTLGLRLLEFGVSKIRSRASGLSASLLLVRMPLCGAVSCGAVFIVGGLGCFSLLGLLKVNE